MTEGHLLSISARRLRRRSAVAQRSAVNRGGEYHFRHGRPWPEPVFRPRQPDRGRKAVVASEPHRLSRAAADASGGCGIQAADQSGFVATVVGTGLPEGCWPNEATRGTSTGHCRILKPNLMVSADSELTSGIVSAPSSLPAHTSASASPGLRPFHFWVRASPFPRGLLCCTAKDTMLPCKRVGCRWHLACLGCLLDDRPARCRFRKPGDRMSKTAAIRLAPSPSFFGRVIASIDRLLMRSALIAIRNGDPPYFGL